MLSIQKGVETLWESFVQNTSSLGEQVEVKMHLKPAWTQI